MWQILIENLPKKSWNTRQHVPPCLITPAMRNRIEICQKANKQAAENAFQRNRQKLIDQVGNKKVFTTRDVSILTSKPGVLVFLHKMVERGYLHSTKVRDGSYETYLWEWVNENHK